MQIWIPQSGCQKKSRYCAKSLLAKVSHSAVNLNEEGYLIGLQVTTKVNILQLKSK